MSWHVSCPNCRTALRLERAPIRATRITCNRCAFAFVVQGSSARQRTDDGFDDTPPPRPALRRAVIWGGAIVFGCVVLMLTGLAQLLEWPTEGFVPQLAILCAGGFCGGHFATALADRAKLRHALYAGCNALFALLLAVLLMPAIVLAEALASASPLSPVEMARAAGRMLAANWETVTLTAAGLTAFLAGWLLERLVMGFVRLVTSQNRWTYVTAAGRRVTALDPWRHPIQAVLWRLAGVLLWLCAWLPLVVADQRGQAAVGVLEFLALGWVCFGIARRRVAPTVRAELARSPKPPIVYLRSFHDDGLRTGAGFWHDYLRGWFALFTGTLEERLAKRLRRFGPFVAIGRPGEELPAAGAARMYVTDDDWQAVVGDLLRTTGTVALIQAGATRGLRWELGRIGRELRHDQVLIFLPFGLTRNEARRTELYEDFFTWANACLPVNLPEELERCAFIYFTEGWKPRTLTRDDVVPPRHALTPILRRLQRDRLLCPRSPWLFYLLLTLAVLSAACLFCGVPLGVFFYHMQTAFPHAP